MMFCTVSSHLYNLKKVAATWPSFMTEWITILDMLKFILYLVH